MNRENRLITGKIGPTLMRLSFAYFLTLGVENLYPIIGMVIVDRYAGAVALSAVTVSGRVMMVITALIMGCCAGVTVMVGQRTGQGDNAAISKVIANSAIVMCLLAAGILFFVIFGRRIIVSLMQTPFEAAESARNYLLIRGLGVPLLVCCAYIGEIYHGLGDVKTPLIFAFVSCAIKCVSAFVFIGYGHMGALGDAGAMVVAHGICSVLMTRHLFSSRSKILPSRRELRPQRKVIGEMARISLPMIFYFLQSNVSLLVITAIINTGGLIMSAAAGVSENIINIELVIPAAVGQAILVMSAQNLGAGQTKRANRTFLQGLLFCILCGLLFCLFCQFAPQVLPGVITHDAAVKKAAALYLRTYSIDCILMGAIHCFNAFFMARGKSSICMGHAFVAAVLGRIPLSYMISHMAGTTLLHMGFAAPASSILSLVICVFFIYRLKLLEKVKMVPA